jgi:iron complex outermembrane recepter protein
MKKIIILISSLLFIVISGYSQNMTIDTFNLPELVVTTNVSASKNTPFTFQNLTPKEISLVQNSEPAVLFSTTPSVTVTSDNGTGLGYIYYRIRGIDQTKINSTFNGIPLNEPEDQGIYYNNFPGFLKSVSNVQVIRGVGLSKPGISAYGGSINFTPLEFEDKMSGHIEGSYGSYNTSQIHAGINTRKFFVNGSWGKTDGYRYNSFNNSLSAFYGLKFKVKQSEFKWYGFVGRQENGMAWLGETIEDIYKDPRFNSNTPNEQDLFTQTHNQLNWTYKNLKTTLYYTSLTGKYGVNQATFGGEGVDTINLKSNWVGLNSNYRLLKWNNFFINTGVTMYTYGRKHFGDVSAPYSNTGYKNSISPYGKAEWNRGESTIYGDVQYRYSTLSYDGDQKFDTKYYHFLNWSGGVNLKLSSSTSIYYGIGRSYKEPKRYDYFGGYENFNPELYTDLVPEKLLSNEFGVKYSKNKLNVNTNVYYMKFEDEMVLTGNTGMNSLALSNKNVPNSYRVGFELDLSYKVTKKLLLSTTSSFSHNRFTDGDFTGTPVLTPTTIINLDARYDFTKRFYTGITYKYNSKSFIDFENNVELPSYTVTNIYAGVDWGVIGIKGNLNNITNQLILGSAYMNWDGTPRYYVMAGINGMVTLTCKF